MGWSLENATNAYLDTLKLRTHENLKRNDEQRSVEPESNEFLSALAAGMGAKLIVEVSAEPSHSTVALAAAARLTGGRLVCILPDEAASMSAAEVVGRCGLRDVVEFKVGDPRQLLPEYANVDFSLVDCKWESYRELLRLLDVNPRRSVVVANRFVAEAADRGGHGGDVGGKDGGVPEDAAGPAAEHVGEEDR